MIGKINTFTTVLCGSLFFYSSIYSGGDIVEKKGEYSMEELTEEKIPLTEDLMREHGVLSRLLLIYEEIARRIKHDENPLKLLVQTAFIIHEFIENYHEKLEENFIFPLFVKQKKEVDLVETLRKQHASGRIITEQLKTIPASSNSINKKMKKQIVSLIKKFIRMYRPHKAREDTVLFPQIRSLISKKEFEELGERFENKEHELFGEDGFFSIVKKVEAIEKELGIYDLAQFTP